MGYRLISLKTAVRQHVKGTCSLNTVIDKYVVLVSTIGTACRPFAKVVFFVVDSNRRGGGGGGGGTRSTQFTVSLEGYKVQSFRS